MQKKAVIQSFGRFFVGNIDMYMEENFKIQMDEAEEPFNLRGVSPFSIAGEPDPAMQKYSICERTNPRVKADMRKNFGDICKKAKCDWFVMDNTAALIGLCEINGRFYSLMGGEKTDFTDEYHNNKATEEKASYLRPWEEGFCERYQHLYDVFINTVLQHYSPERIILVVSHVPRFRFDGRVVIKTAHPENVKVFLQDLDFYFFKRTGCKFIDTPARFFEEQQNSAIAPFSEIQMKLKAAIEKDIIDTIRGKHLGSEHALSSYALLHDDSGGWHRGIRMLFGKFFKKGEIAIRSISDYIARGGTDINVFSAYFSRASCTPDDILAVYHLLDGSYFRFGKRDIALGILSNQEGSAYFYTKRLFMSNMAALASYKYCLIDMTQIKHRSKIVITLGRMHYIEVDENGMRLFGVNCGEFKHDEFVENGYVCGIGHIEEALGSFEVYFERGRRKCVVPFVLEFCDMAEFERSLYFVDYADVLENECYVLKVKGMDVQASQLEDYRPKVDLSFVFDENTRICRIDSGLADQLFLIQQYASSCGDSVCYINDIRYDEHKIHQGADSKNVVPVEFKARFLSNLLSKKLRQRFLACEVKGVPLSDIWKWQKLGLHEAYAAIYQGLSPATPAIYEKMKVHEKDIPVIVCKTRELLASFTEYKIPGKPLFVVSKNQPHETNFYSVKHNYEKYFEFPEIVEEDDLNHETQTRILSSFAVGIHLRRGDHVVGTFAANWKEHIKFNSAVDFIFNGRLFDSQKPKHLFVFSDDMEYAKANSRSFGFNIFGENITYVDWNRHLDSFRDMHLLSLCNVIIRGIGGFATAAGLISRRVDYIVSVTSRDVRIDWQRHEEHVPSI